MYVIDGHCDFLSKLLADPHIDFEKGSKSADISLLRLRQGNVSLQFFAIYLSEKLKQPGFSTILEMIDLGYRHIFQRQDMILIRSREDLKAVESGSRTGALLTLEGVDGLNGTMTELRTLFYLGVRSVGITWNHANWAADGVGEPRGAGFSVKGRQLIKECAKLGMMLDVSHLSEKAFWELCGLYEKPFLASHSNVYKVCPHPRNLNDNQIAAIIKRGGMIGLTFVPSFVKPDKAQAADLLTHIDHICALGGAGCVGFGSDFDGIEQWIEGVEHPGGYRLLTELLSKHYPTKQTEQFLSGNWLRFLKSALPQGISHS